MITTDAQLNIHASHIAEDIFEEIMSSAGADDTPASRRNAMFDQIWEAAYGSENVIYTDRVRSIIRFCDVSHGVDAVEGMSPAAMIGDTATTIVFAELQNRVGAELDLMISAAE